MDGKSIIQIFLDAIEQPRTDLLTHSPRRIYNLLDQVAVDFCELTSRLKAQAVITTVQDQKDYDLPPAFIRLYLTNALGNFITKYDDGSGEPSWPVNTKHENLITSSDTGTKEKPGRFSIIDTQDALATVAGTCTETRAVAGGEVALIDSGIDFIASKVRPRDIVHNTARGARGMVLEVQSATMMRVAMFTTRAAGWTDGDTYVITPMTHKTLRLDAPSATAGHAITVPYVTMCDPVFSDYGFWRFSPKTCTAIAQEAAYRFLKGKKKSQAPNNDLRRAYLSEIRDVKRTMANNILRGTG